MATESHPDDHTKKQPATPAQPVPHARPDGPRRLYRSRTDQMLGGVAGGMAEYFGIDSTLMRLIFIVLVLLPGIGVIAYIIAWIVIPEEPAPADNHAAKDDAPVNDTAPVHHEHAKDHRAGSSSESSRRALGLILVALGAFFLLRAFIDFSQFARLWPLLLVFIGLAIIFGRSKR